MKKSSTRCGVIPFATFAFSFVLDELRDVFEVYDGSSPDAWLLPSRIFSLNRPRERRTVRSIFDEYGPIYTRRAYRMDESAFWKLHDLLKAELNKAKRKAPGADPSSGHLPSELRLSAALRYFAGGDAYDIMISHGISHSAVYHSILSVVDAVNQVQSLEIKFPRDHATQRSIAEKFQKKSKGANQIPKGHEGSCTRFRKGSLSRLWDYGKDGQ